MNTGQAKQLSEDALSRLMTALEQGQSETLRAYLALMARFHRYSWGNALLIYWQRPEATHVAGFHAWLRMRRYVRKGEKSIIILAPLVGRIIPAENGEDALVETPKTRVFGFRAAHVFDVTQTEGDPLPELSEVQGDPAEYTQRLKEFVSGRGMVLDYSPTIHPARGISSGGKITLLPDLSPAEEFSVLVHETGHELLHRGERRAATTRTIRETEAEAVAFVVCQAIGLDTNTASSDYIQLHSGDKDTLAESLGFVQKTAAEILSAILPTHRAAQTPTH